MRSDEAGAAGDEDGSLGHFFLFKVNRQQTTDNRLWVCFVWSTDNGQQTTVMV